MSIYLHRKSVARRLIDDETLARNRAQVLAAREHAEAKQNHSGRLTTADRLLSGAQASTVASAARKATRPRAAAPAPMSASTAAAIQRRVAELEAERLASDKARREAEAKAEQDRRRAEARASWGRTFARLGWN